MTSQRTESGSVYDVILRQHLDFRRMCSGLIDNQDSQLLEELRSYITGHERAEELTVFKDLMSETQLRDLTFEMSEEHHVADTIMEELVQTQPGGDIWRARAKVFKEVVEQHLNEEESELFPKAQQARDEQWAQRMAQEFEEQQREHAGETEVKLPQFA